MNKRSRRGFLETAAALAVSAGTECLPSLMAFDQTAKGLSAKPGGGRPITARDFLAGILNTRAGSQEFLRGTRSTRDDSELGWMLGSYQAANDGIDGLPSAQ